MFQLSGIEDEYIMAEEMNRADEVELPDFDASFKLLHPSQVHNLPLESHGSSSVHVAGFLIRSTQVRMVFWFDF